MTLTKATRPHLRDLFYVYLALLHCDQAQCSKLAFSWKNPAQDTENRKIEESEECSEYDLERCPNRPDLIKDCNPIDATA